MTLLRWLLAPEPAGPIARRRRFVRRPRSAVRRHDLPATHPVRLRGRDVEPRARVMTWRDRLLPDVLLVLLLFAISFGQNMIGVHETAFHPDESRWLNRAYYIRDLADPFGSTWQDYVTTVGQPPLGSYVMGVGLAVQGRPLDATGVWDFAYGTDWNAQAGASPSAADLTAGRQTNALIGALVVAVVYVLGRLLTNRAGGLLGGLFLAFHPLHITLSSQALSDETFVLVLALSFLAAWFFAKRPTWGRAILLGILLGLGGAAKLSPLLLSLPLAGFGVLRLIVDRDRAARDYAIKLLLQPVIAFATFVAVYPFLWPDPIRRTWELFQFRATEMQGQATAWPEVAVTSPLDAVGRFGARLTEIDSTTKRLVQVLYDVIGIERTATGIDFIPAIAGLILLLFWVIKYGFWTPTALVTLLMGAEVGAMAVGMGTDFYRYHLPIVVIMAIWIAVATGAAWDRLVPFVRKRAWQPARRTAIAPVPAAQPARQPRERLPLMPREASFRASTPQDPQP
ncbi:MAG TPA: phospholipid carrier-dependent glycosyltransferase [Thermomicrobiales bacterium]|nr:phospholipid carrier-dependent glycosyltransferase [Thermomicrobiales bacterium]